MKELLELADSRDPNVRGSALTALGYYLSPPAAKLAAIKKLLLALDDDDLRLAKLAVIALGRLKTDDATDKLLQLLKRERMTAGTRHCFRQRLEFWQRRKQCSTHLPPLLQRHF